MGFLSSLWNSVTGPSDVEEAILDTITLAIIADGVVTDEEVGYAISFLASLLEVDEEDAADFVDAAFKRVQSAPPEDALDRIVEHLQEPRQREVAFIAAAVVNFVDGEIDIDEERFLSVLGEAFGFDDDTITHLVDEASSQAEDALIEAGLL